MWVTPSPREAIWLFPLPSSLSRAKRCPAWAPPAAHRAQQWAGTPEAQLLLQMCPQREQDRQLRRQSLHRQGAGNVLPGGSRKVQPPKASPQCQSHPLATVLLFQRGNPQLLTLLAYPSTELGTGIWIIARQKRVVSPHPLPVQTCQIPGFPTTVKHLLSRASSELQDEAALEKSSTTKQLVLIRSNFFCYFLAPFAIYLMHFA